MDPKDAYLWTGDNKNEISEHFGKVQKKPLLMLFRLLKVMKPALLSN